MHAINLDSCTQRNTCTREKWMITFSTKTYQEIIAVSKELKDEEREIKVEAIPAINYVASAPSSGQGFPGGLTTLTITLLTL